MENILNKISCINLHFEIHQLRCKQAFNSGCQIAESSSSLGNSICMNHILQQLNIFPATIAFLRFLGVFIEIIARIKCYMLLIASIKNSCDHVRGFIADSSIHFLEKHFVGYLLVGQNVVIVYPLHAIFRVSLAFTQVV
jgi:hypothetical protein